MLSNIRKMAGLLIFILLINSSTPLHYIVQYSVSKYIKVFLKTLSNVTINLGTITEEALPELHTGRAFYVLLLNCKAINWEPVVRAVLSHLRG